MPREGEARWLAVVEYTSLFDSLVQLFLFNCTVGTEGGGGLDAKGGRGQVVGFNKFVTYCTSSDCPQMFLFLLYSGGRGWAWS